MGWECSKNWRKDNACKKLRQGNVKYMNNLGRSKRRWEDNIKINLKETELYSVQWIRLMEGGYE